MPDSDADVLIARGDLAGAAALLETSGDHRRAARLYEQLWDFEAAARAARVAGDLPRALQNLLRANTPAAIDTLIAEVATAPIDVRLRCAEVCVERGALVRAAELFRGADRPAEAAELFERARLHIEAAELHERCGDPRRALLLYRQHLDEEPDALQARLALGRLLLRFGQHAEALPLLQQAFAAGVLSAGSAAVAALKRLGYHRAAEEAFERLRERQTSLHDEAGARDSARSPASVEACLDLPELAPLPPDRSAAEGDTRLAGRYQLGQLLGSGGMGRVYRARDELHERDVAVKVFTAPGGARGRDAYARFVREALTTGRLQHPHIVSLVDFDEERGFLVLEFMGGGDLASRLRPRLDVGTCRSVLLQLLSGLGAAHQRGIVHRDIKPSNIFFSSAGAAKLGDFGVAHLQDLAQTQTGGFIGTLAYMSPEQISGDRITFATDTYAIGVTLFVMLTGELPFSPPRLIDKHLTEPAPRPSSRQPDVPAICDEVVLRCMAKQPEDRFESLAALAQVVELFPQQSDAVAARRDPAESHPERRRATDTRYTVESIVHDHPALQIFKARDNELCRQVTLLRLAPGDGRESLLRLLRAAARADIHLQRVVTIDPAGGHVVLERWSSDDHEPARQGQRLDRRPRDPATALRLCQHLGLALTPLHEDGVAHGRVIANAVMRWGEIFLLGLTEALLAWTTTDVGSPAQPCEPASDIAAAARLSGLEIPAELQTGAALAAWATEQLQIRSDRAHANAQRQLLDRCMASMPLQIGDRAE